LPWLRIAVRRGLPGQHFTLWSIGQVGHGIVYQKVLPGQGQS
jgi:hypothetical protein